jgi:uncharacterized membrane protein YgdD (TMEM256/DUF423 family)
MNATTRLFIGAGALCCMAGVVTGAFGAHALEQVLSPERLQTWGKGVDYLFVHALGLILLGALEAIAPRKCHRVAGVFMVAGMLLFCGSLFVLVLSGVRWLGMITPLGGVSFVAAWLVLGVCYLVANVAKTE